MSGDFASHGELCEMALQIARQRQPNASPQKNAAFANSVATLVTGVSGGYGGPSVREHVAAILYAGRYTFNDAVELLIKPDGPIFGPLTDLHREIWDEEADICFDDDPGDLEELG